MVVYSVSFKINTDCSIIDTREGIAILLDMLREDISDLKVFTEQEE